MSELTRRKTSILWTAFIPVDSRFAICKLCKKQLSYKSSTTNLRKHLTMIHKTVVLPTDNSMKRDNCEQSSFDENEVDMKCNLFIEGIDSEPHIQIQKPIQYSNDSMTPSSSSQYYITPENLNTNLNNEENQSDELLGLFIKDFQPYSIVDSPGFRKFVTALNPTYELPDRQVISKILIPNEYMQCLNKTQEIIRTYGSSFCISIDSWTNNDSVHYVAVNASFLDENFNLKLYLLECFPISSNQSSKRLAKRLKRIIINDWNIDESQIQLVVSGNNQNIKEAIETELNWKRFECFINTINSIVNEVLNLPDIKPLIDKIQKVSQKHIKSKVLKNSRENWNSIYSMLERFIQLEETIKQLLISSANDLQKLDLLEWQMARELYQILKPFESVMKSLGDENSCTASLVIPMLSVLKALYNDLIQADFSSYIQEAINYFIFEIDERFNNTEELLSIETFLDPRFKNVAFFSANQAELVKQNIINLIKPKLLHETVTVKSENDTIENFNNSRGSDCDGEEKFSIWSAYDKMVANNCHRPATSRAILEVERYLEEGIINRNEDPLKWWNEHKMIYPNLSVLARERLCNLASSALCQQLFTKAEVLLNRKRTSFNVRKIKMLSFLNMNSIK